MMDVAKAAWLEGVERFGGNPSSLHRVGARADRALEGCRERLAGYLGCSPGEIIFTSGATESDNLLVYHLSRVVEGEVWVSAVEHPAVLQALRRWFEGRYQFIPVGGDGVVDPGWVEERFRGGLPGAIILMAANNETGVLQPWLEVAGLCRARGVLFGCDAAQWVGKLAVEGLGACDFVAGCGHKFGGGTGVGFLKGPLGMVPLIVGGPQEDRRRGGTENLPGVMGLVAALEAREREIGAGAVERMEVVRDRFISGVLAGLPGSRLIGAGVGRLWNTVSLQLPERRDGRRWVVALDREGFAVSSGSACSSGQGKASHVLAAMGLGECEADRVIRISSGWESPEESWDSLLRVLLAAELA